MMSPTVISIAGASGVGKTTISRMLAVVTGLENSLILSDDDLHKWSREHKNWKKYTHFDPAANNLTEGKDHIQSLKSGMSISRSTYNHETGNFNKSKIIKPAKVIINEGLHTLYLKESKEIADIKIYVEADSFLKDQWKIKRDISKRGYNLPEVIETINRRKVDEDKYILPQKKYADIIVEFLEQDGKVCVTYKVINKKYEYLALELDALYKSLTEFVDVSSQLSKRTDITQNKGGNMSFSWNNSLIITSSGISFSDITHTDGFTYCNSKGKKVFNDQRNPSMEVNIHSNYRAKYMLHTHPSYVLAVMCCEESEQIIKELFTDVGYIEYFCPGKDLFENFNYEHDIVFARNHGLFVGGKNLQECFNKTSDINNKIKQFLLGDKSNEYLFPDACVLENENLFLCGFVENLIKDKKLTPRFLTSLEVSNILNLEEEKYRAQL